MGELEKRPADVPTRIHPVDGGYGWVMVGVCFLVAVLTVDNYGTLGVFMVESRYRFGISTIDLTWIGASRLSLVGLLGVAVGEVLQNYGSKVVLLTGTLLIFTGHCGCALFPHLGFYWILLTYGILPGLGFCCLCVVQASAFQEYFERRRGLANAIVCVGFALGLFVWSPLLEFLFSYYGWTGTLLIDASIHLHGFVFALLVIPAKQYYAHQRKKQTLQTSFKAPETNKRVSCSFMEECKNTTEGQHMYQPLAQHENNYSRHKGQLHSSCNNFYKLKHETPSLSNSTDLLSTSLMSLAMEKQCSLSHSNVETGKKTNKENQRHSIHIGKTKYETCGSADISNVDYTIEKGLTTKSCIIFGDHHQHPGQKKSYRENALCKIVVALGHTLQKCINFSLLKDIPFLMYCIGISLVHLGMTAPMALITVRAVEVGIDKTLASFLISIFGICNGISIPVWGLVADTTLFSPLKPVICGAAAMMCGCALLSFVLVKDYTGFVVFISFLGIISGGMFSLQTALVAQLLDINKVAKGAGTMYSLIGVSWLLTYVCSGILIDAFGNTAEPFFFHGAVEVLAGIIISTIPLVQRVKRNRDLTVAAG